MTHWSIDDQYASFLAPEFYRLYLKEGFSKIKALAMAKRKRFTIESHSTSSIYYEHPFYWAPFMLYGQAGKLQLTVLLFVFFFITAVAVFVILKRRKIFFSKRRIANSKRMTSSHPT